MCSEEIYFRVEVYFNYNVCYFNEFREDGSDIV